MVNNDADVNDAEFIHLLIGELPTSLETYASSKIPPPLIIDEKITRSARGLNYFIH
jgi:hypothetical protein